MAANGIPGERSGWMDDIEINSCVYFNVKIPFEYIFIREREVN